MKNGHPGNIINKMIRCGLLAAVLAGFCNSPAGAAPFSFTDAAGRTMTINIPIKRVVTINSDATEALMILKAQDMAVGVFSDIVKEPACFGKMTALPKVGSWRDPDAEAIAALKPDAVIAYGNNPSRLLEEKLALFGISVIRLDLYRIPNLEKEIAILGRILGREKEAAAFCAWHHEKLSAITGRVAKIKIKPRVYVESYSDYHAAGNGTGGNDMIVICGGFNIASVFPIAYPRVNPEWVLAQNPDVILKAASWGNGYDQKSAKNFNLRRDMIVKRPAWGGLKAVTGGRVHVMDSEIWVGPRSIVGVAFLVKWLHPGLFNDVDPIAIHREYFNKFIGAPFKGVYVSDSLKPQKS